MAEIYGLLTTVRPQRPEDVPGMLPSSVKVLGERDTLGRDTLTLEKNLNKDKSTWEKIADYLDTSIGQFRFFQFLGKGGNLASEAGIMLPPPVAGVSKLSTTVWHTMAIPTAFNCTRNAVNSIRDAFAIGSAEKIKKAFHETCWAVSMIGYSCLCFLDFIPGAASLMGRVAKGADCFDAGGQVLSMAGSAVDWKHAKDEQAQAATENRTVLVKHFDQARRFHFIKAMKAACSVAGFIFGTAAVLLAGSAMATATTLAAVSLASTIFAILADMYEMSMDYKPKCDPLIAQLA